LIAIVGRTFNIVQYCGRNIPLFWVILTFFGWKLYSISQVLPKISLLKLAKKFYIYCILANWLKFMQFFGCIQEFMDIVKETSLYFSAIFIGDYFNVPKWFDLQGLDKEF